MIPSHETPIRGPSGHPRSRYLVDCGDAQLHVHARSTATVLRLEGQIDVSNAESVGRALRRFCLPNASLVLDLSHLEFLGIAGFRTLLGLNDQNRQAGLRCSIVGGTALRLLTHVFTDHGLPVVDSIPEALRLVDDDIRAGVVHQHERGHENACAAMDMAPESRAFG